MPFPAAVLGMPLRPCESLLTPRRILAFAAAVGATEPAYMDDAQEGGLRALPFLCVSLEWPVFQSLAEAACGALTPDETLRGVHVLQDSHFHRPMRAGDRLITEGEAASVAAVRAGALVTLHLRTRDRVTGEPVATSRVTSIYRDVALDGDPGSLEKDRSSATPGPPAPEAGAPITKIALGRGLPHTYSECAGIWNPIHTERAAALAAGLPDIIVHGSATWAMAGVALLRARENPDVGALKRLSARFSAPVTPDDRLEIRQGPAANGSVAFDVRTGAGTVALSHGLAEFEGPLGQQSL